MIQLTLYMMNLILAGIFLQMNHPLAMGLILLVQTTLIALISGLMSQTFWFSYVLFLIFLGGMLVLFIYVTSLASNEMFSLSMNMVNTSIITITIMMIMMFLIDKTMMYQFIENNEMNKMDKMMSFSPENSINLNKLYNLPTNMITILMINYLLITLVVTVKITNVFYGPLRHQK